MKEKVPHPQLLSEKLVKLVNKSNLKSFFFDSFKTLTEDFIICQALSPGYSNKQDKCKHMELTVQIRDS